jgi:NodT family efflux transporter outer membrane factor (OMF) lipoprotein
VKLAARFALITLALVLAGCAVGPNFQRPQIPVPQQWTVPAVRGTSAGIEPQTDLWWKTFQDPELDSLIQRAVEANFDLKLATARVDEARAARGVAKSDYSPQVNAVISVDRDRQLFVAPLPNVRPSSFELNSYRGSFDASWEADVFGRIRREVEASGADLAASDQDRRNVLITVLGDVGRFYAELRGFQLRLAIAEENVAVAGDTLSLTRALAQAGQQTERDVAQAEAQLESVRAQVPVLQSSIALSIHRLGVLTGQHPGALDVELGNPANLPPVPANVPTGIPSDLLERRPDIQRAEAQLAAATARVGQAKADYFPRFTLLGSAGRQATQLHDLTLGLGNFFSAGPSITLPVFTGGRIRSNIAIQKARVKQAFENYQAAVLASLEDMENALVNYANEQERRDRLEATVRASQTARELANVQYKAGLADFLNVLDAERELYTNQDLLAQSRITITTDLVALYKALGGGWFISSQAPKSP